MGRTSYRLGWTGYNPSILWVAPTASGILIGFGIITIFLQFINYLVDSYLSLWVFPYSCDKIVRI
jgi:DHA1 family multidrug resistance protein-like MFS transporter